MSENISPKDNESAKSQVKYMPEQEKSNMENAKKEALEMLQKLVKKEPAMDKQNDEAKEIFQHLDDELKDEHSR